VSNPTVRLCNVMCSRYDSLKRLYLQYLPTTYLCMLYSRSYTLKFRCEEDYQTWRTLLFNTGRDVTETAHLAKYPPAAEEARATADGDERGGADDDTAGEGADKEDAVQQPETTVSLTDLAAALDRSASSVLPAVAGAAKPERGFDLDTTRKFARLLRKDEKVCFLLTVAINPYPNLSISGLQF
jgi:hypothetical protein